MPPSIPSDLKCGNLNAKPWNRNQDKRIVSGDMITFTTENPDTNPLPSLTSFKCNGYCTDRSPLVVAVDVIYIIFGNKQDRPPLRRTYVLNSFSGRRDNPRPGSLGRKKTSLLKGLLRKLERVTIPPP